MTMFTATFTGRLGADPTIRLSRDGKPIASLRVAHTPRVKAADGTWSDGLTSWHSVSLFGAAAEHAAEQLRKGQHVLVAGRVTPREYERDGTKVQTLDVVADTVAVIPGRTQQPSADRSGGPPW